MLEASSRFEHRGRGVQGRGTSPQKQKRRRPTVPDSGTMNQFRDKLGPL